MHLLKVSFLFLSLMFILQNRPIEMFILSKRCMFYHEIAPSNLGDLFAVTIQRLQAIQEKVALFKVFLKATFH